MPRRRNWDQAAGVIWPCITAAAASGRMLTYGELAPLISTNPLSVRQALGPIQSYCMEANLLPLTAIVINKARRKPGPGFIAWDIGDIENAAKAVFAFDWAQIENPFVAFIDGKTEAQLAAALNADPSKAVDVYRVVRNRGVAQRIFRRALLAAYGAQCCICQLSFEEVLQAAHITRWDDCTPQERMDPRNGLLLCANHHALLDAALLSVLPDYRLQYCDPDEAEGGYSDADRALSLHVHDQPIFLPQDSALWPDTAALQRRRIDDEWE